MTRARSIAVLAAVTMVAVTASAGDPADTRSVTDRYLGLTFSRQYDALRNVYAEEAVFLDPTGDVFRGPVGEGAVRGASNIAEMQKSWGLAETRFDIRASFTVGEFSLYRGTLTVRYEGVDARHAIPFVTVLRARDGRILERTDFGAYLEPFGMEEQFAATTDSTREVAARYLRAYLDGDLESQSELMDPAIRFQDPTAQVFGALSGQPLEGSETLLARRAQRYRGLSDFDFDVEESFAGNHHAIVMGKTSYTLASGAHFVQPAVFVIEVRDGKVTRHWDFVDYSVGPVEVGTAPQRP
jgi:ketosteroid isomerase-like protein